MTLEEIKNAEIEEIIIDVSANKISDCGYPQFGLVKLKNFDKELISFILYSNLWADETFFIEFDIDNKWHKLNLTTENVFDNFFKLKATFKVVLNNIELFGLEIGGKAIYGDGYNQLEIYHKCKAKNFNAIYNEPYLTESGKYFYIKDVEMLSITSSLIFTKKHAQNLIGNSTNSMIWFDGNNNIKEITYTQTDIKNEPNAIHLTKKELYEVTYYWLKSKNIF